MSADERILIAEDVQANIALFRAILERDGREVDFAVTGQEAVDRAAAEAYPLILMDVGLPVLDGLTASRRIREAGGLSSNALIVALTADEDRRMETACRDAGMDHFLAKPISPSVLVAKVAELLPLGKERLQDQAA